jgi:transcriptional regulator with XRE-family HTH domain
MSRDRNRAEWFGPRLRELRESAGLTQQQLGERAGVVGSQINKLELGVNQPTLATAVALARALGVEVGAFVPPDLAAPVTSGDGAEKRRPRGRPKKQATGGQLATHPKKERVRKGKG